MGSKNKKGTKKDSKAKEGANGGSNNKGHGEKLITDARFASVHSDPRFQTAPKHKSKVAIDSRFDRMFTDKSFSTSTARIDKRGKPKKEASQNPLKHYYKLDEEEDKKRSEKVKKEGVRVDEESDEEEDKKRSKKVKKHDVHIDEESDEEEGKKRSKKVKKQDVQIDGESESESEPSDFELKSKKVLPESESESEDDDDDDNVVENDESSTSTTDSDEEDEIYSEEEETLVPEENVPEIDKETHRLAVVNMDWNQVKAVDLYVLLSSFLPKGGQILSVAVYPSEFGLKRMEEEAVHGPVGLFDDDEDKNGSDDDDDDEIDNEKLRTYELSRLRYYYAVVECDSVATADYLYKACDGVEFERSSNKLDLRFIPDSMEFKHEPRDVATEAPPSYEGIDFHTQALQQSKIQLTWDEDEPHRSKTLKRKFNADQLAEMEWKELLASDEGATDEEDESDNPTEDKSEKRRKKQDLYRSLVQSGDNSDEEDDDDEKQEMEVTFNTDLEDISKRILEKKDKKSESVWDAYLRERKEKKKSRKNRRKDSSEDESSDDTDREPAEKPDDFFIEEAPVSKKAKGKKGKQEKEMDEDAEASRSELELLIADDKGGETNLKGYNLKRKKAKGKGKEIPDEEKIPTVDYDDPRFSSLFTSPLFALDPTDPQFKRSAAYARQIAQKQQKVDREEMARKEGKKLPAEARSDELEAVKEEHLKFDELPSRKEKHELSSLVKSIKMKSKQVPLPSKGSNKVSGKKGKRPF